MWCCGLVMWFAMRDYVMLCVMCDVVVLWCCGLVCAVWYFVVLWI